MTQPEMETGNLVWARTFESHLELLTPDEKIHPPYHLPSLLIIQNKQIYFALHDLYKSIFVTKFYFTELTKSKAVW
jgi:hypothetical protein